MLAVQNSNFPFITVSSANFPNNGASVMGGKLVAIIENAIVVDMCKNLVYHLDIETAKAYQKAVSDAFNASPAGQELERKRLERKANFKIHLEAARNLRNKS